MNIPYRFHYGEHKTTMTLLYNEIFFKLDESSYWLNGFRVVNPPGILNRGMGNGECDLKRILQLRYTDLSPEGLPLRMG